MIAYEDFSKLDFVVGKILEVEPHPNADKLYLLKVDIGEKFINLVAGIRLYYTPESLKDKLVVVITNLEPRQIRGIISEGMLLAAQDSVGIHILTIDGQAAPGSKVK
jgi:methionyl-tRNA synthetase